MTATTYALCPICGLTIRLALRPTASHCGVRRVQISRKAAAGLVQIREVLKSHEGEMPDALQVADAIQNGEVGPNQGFGLAVLDEIVAAVTQPDTRRTSHA